MSDHEVYVSAHEYAGNCGPVLRCTTCPDWEVDVDGTSFVAAIAHVARHEAELIDKAAGEAK